MEIFSFLRPKIPNIGILGEEILKMDLLELVYVPNSIPNGAFFIILGVKILKIDTKI